nr:IS607 family transposase [Candidatus Freyarchaeota archaeon]
MKEEKLYSTGKTAKMLGIHFLTLKKWIYKGKVKAVKTLGGQYRIPESEIRRLLGQPTPKNQAVIYARVSSADQKEDLKRQKETLQEHAKEKGYQVVAVFEDTASGLNENRRGLGKMFDTLRTNAADIVLITWKDRLTRFGFEYLKSHVEDLGARIETVNEQQEEKTPQEELVEDLLAIVTSFSGRLYGMRSNKTKKVVETVKRTIS